MDNTLTPKRKAVIFAADCGEYNMERSISELYALCDSDDIEIVSELIQKRDNPDNSSYLGEGKLYEGKLVCQNLDAEIAVFDAELTGVQIRNIEDALEVSVMDRTMLILDIFSNRAITNEGKLQVELAKLKYRLPRLIGLGNSLSRQGGGGAGGGGARRGAGESQLEYDRRYIRQRIAFLNEKLEEVENHRNLTRKNRQKNNIPVIAFVGYTNVGKSSLLNKLCESDILAEDKLFATLDPTARKYTMPSGQNVVFVDTVGFVSRLPHHLVNAFKSTLEEAKYADIILKICDITDDDVVSQLEVTDEVLTQLNCGDIPQITVYNKCDDLTNATFFDNNIAHISAKNGLGLDDLISKIDVLLQDRVVNINILIPYDKMALISNIRQNGTLLEEEYQEQGVMIKAIIKKSQAHIFEQYIR